MVWKSNELTILMYRNNSNVFKGKNILHRRPLLQAIEDQMIYSTFLKQTQTLLYHLSTAAPLINRWNKKHFISHFRQFKYQYESRGFVQLAFLVSYGRQWCVTQQKIMDDSWCSIEYSAFTAPAANSHHQWVHNSSRVFSLTLVAAEQYVPGFFPL